MNCSEFLQRLLRFGHDAGQSEAVLPLFIANGRVALSGSYPTRAELRQWLGVVDTTLPKLSSTPSSGECCAGGQC